MMVCLDTNIVIYFVEQHPLWQRKVMSRLKDSAAGDTVAVSDAARLECLVGPLQSGDAAMVADYQRFFASPEIQMLPVTAQTWERASATPGIHRLKPLDSIHLASAIEHGCGMFLTSDAQLARCTEILVELLS